MRKSHNIEEKPGDDMIHIVSPTRSSEQEHTPSFMYTWLQSLMEHLTAYFGERIPRDDLDLLNLSLYHLYRSVDRLYSTTLPLLVAALAMNEKNKQQQYAMWIQLRQSKKALERIEILCHLLSGTLTGVLNALNSSDEKQGRKRLSFPSTLGARAIAFAQLQHQLEEWQRSFSEQQPLLLSITEHMPSSSELGILEKGWGIVLLSVVAIFGDILPDIQGISEGDDEAAATLFLDLTQQTDQILLQTEAMLEPFPHLLGGLSFLEVSTKQ